MGLVIGIGGIHIGTSGGGASPVKRFDAEAEYIKRKAGGTDNIGTGKAKIPTLKGKSVVWNQLVQNGNFADGTTGWGTRSGYTMTVNEGVCTITGRYIYIRQNIGKLEGHKFLLRAYVKASADGDIYSAGYTTSGGNIPGSYMTLTANQWAKYSFISTSALEIFAICKNGSSSEDELSFKNINIFDLTQMFGAGNEPTTVAEFEALYPLPYYDYNPGEIVNNAAEAIETVGFNQLKLTGRTEYSGPNTTPNSTFDFLTEDMLFKGFAANGYLIPDNVASYSVTERSLTVKSGTAGSASAYGVGLPFKVLPNTSYYIKYTSSGGSAGCLRTYVDGAGKIISNHSTSSGTSFTTPQDAAWIIVVFRPGAVNTQSTWSDICINLSDASKNGTYEAYEKHTLQLGLDAFDVKDSEDNIITVNGLKSAGSAFDEIDLARGKYIKRVGAVDMGTLSWSVISGGTNNERARSMDINSLVANVSNVPSVCSKYTRNSVGNVYLHSEDKIFALKKGDEYLIVYDSELIGKTGEQIKSALSGQLLYYELAKPEEYDLVTPIGNSYKVISGGTEERLPRDTASSVMAPIKYSVKYVQPKD